MHPGAPILLYFAQDIGDRRRREADAWRRLHRRPDATPCEPKVVRPSPFGQIATAILLARRAIAR